MGFFDQFQKKGSVAIQPKRAQIRKVEVKSTPPSASSTSNNANSRRLTPSQTPKTRPAADAKSRSKSRDSTRLQPRSSQRLGTPNANSRKRPSPALRLSSSDDDSDADEIPDFRKRAKVSASAEPDLGRQVRSRDAFSEEGEKSLSLVHAADITSVKKAGKFSSAFDESTEPVEVELQYPSASKKER